MAIDTRSKPESTASGTRCGARLWLGALSLALGISCGETPPLNVVFIVIDTLRADHLGCYGASRETSPHIDHLATESVLFERAYATAPWTKPSIASMLTGLFPSEHQVTTLTKILPDEFETLAERFAEAGYETSAVVSSFMLSEKHGFAQGFQSFTSSEGRGQSHVSTPGVTRTAQRELKRLASGLDPFFLFVHYFDPHYTYTPHPEIGFAPPAVGRIKSKMPIRRLRKMLESLTDEEVDYLRDLYDEEIRFTDAGIGRLLSTLEALGLDANTVVVLTADHGEEFMERGWIGHVRTLHEELIHVPLLIRTPNAQPRSIDDPVSLASLMPTILELAGLETRDRAFQAPSIANLLSDRTEVTAVPVFSEVAYAPVNDDPRKRAFQNALIGERYKLIHDKEDQSYALYDLIEDPFETQNLIGKEPELAMRLKAQLQARVRVLGQGRAPVAELELSETDLELLRGLGYVDSNGD